MNKIKIIHAIFSCFISDEKRQITQAMICLPRGILANIYKCEKMYYLTAEEDYTKC